MIFDIREVRHIYLSNQYVDMRKSIDGLSLIVNNQFDLNVLDHSLFIFTNKARNRIKILYYENSGFWLFLKRMEHGRFKIKESDGSRTKMITDKQLNWLLEGLEFEDKNPKKQLII